MAAAYEEAKWPRPRPSTAEIIRYLMDQLGDRCSFDAIVRIFDIHDPALDRLATIVRGADTSRSDLAPQCDGLLAISYGLSANCPDDHEMLEHGMVIYDALYKWCRLQTAARTPAEKISA